MWCHWVIECSNDIDVVVIDACAIVVPGTKIDQLWIVLQLHHYIALPVASYVVTAAILYSTSLSTINLRTIPEICRLFVKP